MVAADTFSVTGTLMSFCGGHRPLPSDIPVYFKSFKTRDARLVNKAENI